jgi:hypothetical protein
MWNNSSNVVSADFIPADNASPSPEHKGIDVSQPFYLVSGGPYGPLPGFEPGYFEGSAPDIGAMQKGGGGNVAPPAVSITSPASGSTYTVPATVNVTASAAAVNGTVAQVEFFSNGVSVGVDTSAPYQVSLNALAAGSYTLDLMKKGLRRGCLVRLDP